MTVAANRPFKLGVLIAWFDKPIKQQQREGGPMIETRWWRKGAPFIVA